MVAAARAEIGNVHARLEAETGDDLLRLLGGIPLLLGRPDRADDLGDRAVRLGKGARRCARRPKWPDVLRVRGRRKDEQNDKK